MIESYFKGSIRRKSHYSNLKNGFSENNMIQFPTLFLNEVLFIMNLPLINLSHTKLVQGCFSFQKKLIRKVPNKSPNDLKPNP